MSLDKLLGQTKIVDEIDRVLRSGTTRVARLTGPSGAGKSRVAASVANHWAAAGDRVILATGDDTSVDRPLHPLLVALANAPVPWSDLASGSGRAAVRAADTVLPTGGTGASFFDLLSSAFRNRSERALRPFSSVERQIIVDLKRIARRRPVLLICDNAHWWDGDSLWLLHQVLNGPVRQEISALDRIAVLVVDTASEQTVMAPGPFEALANLAGPNVLTASLCSRADFVEALSFFGCDLSPDSEVLDALYAASGGHLKLIEQVAAYVANDGLVDLLDRPDRVHALFAARIGSLGPQGAPVVDLLLGAAVIGLTFGDEEVRCLLGKGAASASDLIKQARAINLLTESNNGYAFAHEIVRRAILDLQAPGQLEGHRRKFESCLSLLRPGDYGNRSELLALAGDPAGSRTLAALGAVQRLRQGVDGPRVVGEVKLARPADLELIGYIETMAEGYRAVGEGDFRSDLPKLRTPMSSESPLMAAERNYLVAVCLMEHQSTQGANEADRLLEQWERAAQHESELSTRMMLLRQQAQIIGERYDDARATEAAIECRLHRRAQFDGEAAVALQIQNRRAGALSTAEVAEVRIEEAVRFFRRGTGVIARDRLELYRAMTNLGAIRLRLGKNAKAYETLSSCESLVAEAPEDLPRLDVLASNLVLSGLRCGAYTIAEAIDRQQIVVDSDEGAGDKFLARCNLAAFHLLADQDDQAHDVLDGLRRELSDRAIDEGYLVYYRGATEVAAMVLSGDLTEALRFHAELAQVVASLNWPGSPYVRRRMELLPSLLASVDPSDRHAADDVLIRMHPVEIGPPWSYYARLMPCCELSFWSDP